MALKPIEYYIEKFNSCNFDRSFIGVSGDYIGGRSRIQFKCNVCESVNTSLIRDTLNYRCCKTCLKSEMTAIHTIGQEKQIEKLNTLFPNRPFVGVVGEWKGTRSVCLFHCLDCNSNIEILLKDALVKRCCRICCTSDTSKLNRKPESYYIDRIKKDATLEFIGWEENFTGSNTPYKVKCKKCNSSWVRISCHSKSKCRDCVGHKSKTKPSTFYIQRIVNHGVGSFIKFGIATDVELRMKNQARKSVFKHYILHEIHLPDNKDVVRSLETKVKNEFNCGVVLDWMLPDGYTETLHFSDLSKLIRFITEELGDCHGNAYK